MKRFIEQYNGEVFDIAIIGGGITGAAVAYDAAARGYSVALVEKGDFGGATSSATLSHGKGAICSTLTIATSMAPLFSRSSTRS